MRDRHARDSEFLRRSFELLDQSALSSSEAEAMKDQLYQVFLQTLPEASTRKASIHPKGTAGFNRDALRAFAYQMFHGAHQLARLKHGDILANQLRAMEEAGAALEDPDRQAKAADIVSELKRRYEWAMNPTNAAWTSRATSFGFAWYLGMSPGAALVNLTQQALVTYPLLALRFGKGKAFLELTRANGDYVASRFNDRRRRQLERQFDGDLGRMIRQLEEEGAIDRTLAHSLAGVSEADYRLHDPVWQKGMQTISWLFHHAEKMNREATAIAAYRLARNDNKSHEDAVNEARDMIYGSHFDYCVDTETEVLTTAGWRRYDQVRPGDILIGVDENGRAVESKALEVNVFSGHKNVIEFQSSRRFSMALTPNHDALIQHYDSRTQAWSAIRKVQAQNIRISHHVLRVPLAPIKGRESAYGSDFAALLGWIAAEGWYAKFRGCTQYSDVRLAQSEIHNAGYVEEIRGILSRIGKTYSEQPPRENGVITWTIGGELRKQVLAAMPDKLLTWDLVATLSAEEMRALVNSFCKGDGNQRSGGGWTVAQAEHNRQNLEVIQAMCAMLGVTASLDQDGNTLIVCGQEKSTIRTHARTLTKTEKIVDTVWCPTTEHGTWIARRRGTVFVTGNSNANRARWMHGKTRRYLEEFLSKEEQKKLRLRGRRHKKSTQDARSAGLNVDGRRQFGFWRRDQLRFVAEEPNGLDNDKNAERKRTSTSEEAIHQAKRARTQGSPSLPVSSSSSVSSPSLPPHQVEMQLPFSQPDLPSVTTNFTYPGGLESPPTSLVMPLSDFQRPGWHRYIAPSLLDPGWIDSVIVPQDLSYPEFHPSIDINSSNSGH